MQPKIDHKEISLLGICLDQRESCGCDIQLLIGSDKAQPRALQYVTENLDQRLLPATASTAKCSHHLQ